MVVVGFDRSIGVADQAKIFGSRLSWLGFNSRLTG